MTIWNRQTTGGRKGLIALSALCLLVTTPLAFQGDIDLCGCRNVPNLQPFDSDNSATFPPGTSVVADRITFTLPPDGILRFSSFRMVNRHVSFVHNAANTPVQILVAGDMTIQSTAGCCYTWSVSGGTGSNGTTQFSGQGGMGGPGGFRGGDGAYQSMNGAAVGGTGFGPGGGAGATASPFVNGSGGTFIGLPELTPLVGGSGGGGGSSTTTGTCAAGGGGGGGGALLIVANGTFAATNYQFFADGGGGGNRTNSTCSSFGGGGSGGAIRMVANRFANVGTTELFARPGGGATHGRTRIESVDGSAQVNFTGDPVPIRVIGPTPIAAAIVPTVTFASVNGAPVPVPPQGTFGAIDVTLNAPGDATFILNTTGVPSGTSVIVTVKPRIGAAPLAQTVPVQNCTAAGACQASATFGLTAGAYVAEARATFQVQ
jgi:hypothetical protein